MTSGGFRIREGTVTRGIQTIERRGAMIREL